MSTALDRQIRPIYGRLSMSSILALFNAPLDALDTGSNKSAIVSCNKLLKKHPKNELIKVPDCCMPLDFRFTYCPGIESSRVGQVTED